MIGARAYFQFVAVMYGLLTVLGLIPATQTTFGLVPIHGNDVWLHAIIVVAAAVVGFAMPARTAAAVRIGGYKRLSITHEVGHGLRDLPNRSLSVWWLSCSHLVFRERLGHINGRAWEVT
jgi:hypothetical protein